MLETKRGKALAAVLGVAVAIFVADRILGLVPMGPETAEASAGDGTASLHDEFGKEMRATAALTNIPLEPRTLAKRLKELRDEGGIDPMNVRDAMRPSRGWLGQGEPAPARPRGPRSRDLAVLYARQFLQRHKLTATAVSANGGTAIIDGQCVTVGRTLDGMRLVSVDRRSATFQGGGIRVRLTLAKD